VKKFHIDGHVQSPCAEPLHLLFDWVWNISSQPAEFILTFVGICSIIRMNSLSVQHSAFNKLPLQGD